MNTTQGKIAIILSATILVLGYAIMLVVYYVIAPFSKWLFTIPLLSGGIVYILSLALIELFILKNIRILYRIVRSAGMTKPNKNSLQDPQLFEKLRIQMENYTLSKSEEINQLLENENFRKEFIANIGHELKTPLASIQGFAEILSDSELDEATKTKYIQRILQNSYRLSAIISDLTTISKAENSQLKLHLEKFSIYELILECIDNLDDLIKPKNIQIGFRKDDNIHFMVRADRFRISQVIQNLVENAIHYNPPKTKIEFRFFDLNNQVFVEISDNGTGIESGHLSRIFERFYRVDNDRSRQTGGTGLGLSIVKHIIEAHQQIIKVESEFGKGTVFQFSLDRV